MAVVAGLQEAGVFLMLAQKLLSGELPVRRIALILMILPFFSSMLVTNDVALITFVPFAMLVLEMVDRRNLIIPVVCMQTIAANLGSMATPRGQSSKPLPLCQVPALHGRIPGAAFCPLWR